MNLYENSGGEKGKWKLKVLPCGLEFELEAWGDCSGDSR